MAYVLTVNGVNLSQPGIQQVDRSLMRLLSPSQRRGEHIDMPYVEGAVAFPRRKTLSVFDLAMTVWGEGDVLLSRLLTLRSSVFEIDLSVTPTVPATLTGLPGGVTLSADVQPANAVFADIGGAARVTFDLIVPAGAFQP